MQLVYAIAAAFLLDLCLGDPRWLPHPVVHIGRLIAALEKTLRSILPATKGGERVGGAILVVLVLAVTGGLSFGLLSLAGCIHPALGFALQTFWCYQILATRCLADEAEKVQKALKTGSLKDARTQVGYLVGRDTQSLSETGVIKATVETVAENTSDGVVGPLFYLVLGGAGLGMLYKAVNTMDSMVGYRNDCYRYFGTAAARLDDVLCWLPARLSALCMILGAGLCGLSVRGGARIWKRDRKNHKSPNSAQTESVCAGALGVQLAGDAWYFGVLHHKKTIGDDLRPVEPRDITRSCNLLYATAALSAAVLLAARSLCMYLL